MLIITIIKHIKPNCSFDPCLSCGLEHEGSCDEGAENVKHEDAKEETESKPEDCGEKMSNPGSTPFCVRCGTRHVDDCHFTESVTCNYCRKKGHTTRVHNATGSKLQDKIRDVLGQEFRFLAKFTRKEGGESSSTTGPLSKVIKIELEDE